MAEAKTEGNAGDAGDDYSLHEHPLFMDPSKLTEKDFEENEHLAALRAMQYSDSDTPQGQAEDEKKRGNDAFRRGPKFFKHALFYYNNALRHCKAASSTGDVKQLASQVLSNRAAIHLTRKDWSKAKKDCETSLTEWPRNAKAYYRLARANLELGNPEEALEASELGLKAAPGDKVLQTVLGEAQSQVDERKRRQEKIKAESEKKREKLAAVRAACQVRDLAVGPPLMSGMRQTEAVPYLDGDESLHWPVLILYEEKGQTDFIEDWHEAVPVGEMLSHVLPDQGPFAPWDEKHEYTASKVDVYVKTEAVKRQNMDLAWSGEDLMTPIPAEGVEGKEGRWVKVPSRCPLFFVLSHSGYVIPDIPTLHVVSRDSEFGKEWAKRGPFPQVKTPALK